MPSKTTARHPSLLGLSVDATKAAELAQASYEAASVDDGYGPVGRPFGANFNDTGGAMPLNPTLYWFPTAEELVAFLAGAACAAMGEDNAPGTPAERATDLCAAILKATDVETILDVCEGWFGWSEVTWVGTIDDLYESEEGVSQEARDQFRQALSDVGEAMPRAKAAKKQRFIEWVEERCTDGSESGF